MCGFDNEYKCGGCLESTLAGHLFIRYSDVVFIHFSVINRTTRSTKSIYRLRLNGHTTDWSDDSAASASSIPRTSRCIFFSFNYWLCSICCCRCGRCFFRSLFHIDGQPRNRSPLLSFGTAIAESSSNINIINMKWNGIHYVLRRSQINDNI